MTSQPVRTSGRQKAASARERGLAIVGISEDSPADRAGLLVGDIMVEAAGVPLDAPEDLLALLTPDRIDQSLRVTVVRGAAIENVTVIVGQRPRRS